MNWRMRLGAYLSTLLLGVSALSSSACGGAASVDDTPTMAAAGSSGVAGAGGASSCEVARDGYSALIAQLGAAQSDGACSVDSDCAAIDSSGCGNDCSFFVVGGGSAARAEFETALARYRAAHCTQCAFEALHCAPDVAVTSPVCVDKQCRPYHTP